MLARPLCLTVSLFSALLVAATIGCSKPEPLDPAVISEYRTTFLVDEEPAGAESPIDLREQEGGFSEGEVVLIGQIGGVANPWKQTEPEFPWKSDEATFFLVDAGTAAAFSEHTGDDPNHAEECAFCAAHAADNVDSIAVVTFTDATGKPIAADARELLDLQNDAVVVVQGKAKMAGELLIVQADSLYVRE
ncbi:MAG: hypothetical protein AAGF31_06425 [Planctomycetota bacterium]